MAEHVGELAAELARVQRVRVAAQQQAVAPLQLRDQGAHLFVGAEDVGAGDVTTQLCVPADRRATGHFIVRETAVVAGVELLSLLYNAVEIKAKSGERADPGSEIAAVRGSARLLLTRERVALNFLQHLSGVATLARRFVAFVRNSVEVSDLV